MKKTIITTAFLSIISLNGALAQQKGDNLTGINLGFGNTSSESSQFNNSSEGNFFVYGLGYTYFFKENKGIRATFSSSVSKYETDIDAIVNFSSKGKSNGFGINYYALFPLAKTFFISATPGISYQNLKIESKNSDFKITEETKIKSSSVNVSAGLFWLPFKKIGLSLDFSIINLSFQKTKNNFISSNPQNGSEQSSIKGFALNLSTQNIAQNQAITIFYKF